MSRPKPRRSADASPPPAQPRTLRTTLDEMPRVQVTPVRGAPAPLKGAPAPRTTSDGVLPLPSLKPTAEAPGVHPPLPRTPRRR